MRILVIDDDYVSRVKIKAILNDYGDCDSAPDGFLALELFKKSHEESAPYDLVTIDINMPGKNGLEVLKGIRDIETMRGIEWDEAAKVIMITVSKVLHDVENSYYEGCQEYCVKPITPQKIKDALKNLKILSE